MAERYEQNAVLRIQPAGDAGDVGIRDGQLGRGLGAAADTFQNYYTDTHLKGQAIRQLHCILTQHPMLYCAEEYLWQATKCDGTTSAHPG